MVTKIRHSVFETNSSSSHSISWSRDVTKLLDSIGPDVDGNIVLTGGEFGWGYERYSDAWTKANYCAVDVAGTPNEEVLKRIIREHTGAKRVTVQLSSDAYIDHQSQGTAHDLFDNEEDVKQFIFNRNISLIIDNDNH